PMLIRTTPTNTPYKNPSNTWNTSQQSNQLNLNNKKQNQTLFSPLLTCQEKKDWFFLPFIQGEKMKISSSSSSSSSSRRRISSRGLSGVLREQRARLYIIRRCVVMLLCYHD
ncbi:hypothetical protein Pfo_023800, partial [Paulownia fortunei]